MSCRICLIFLCVIAFAGHAYCDLKLGIRAGITISGATFEPRESISYRNVTGPVLGVSAEYYNAAAQREVFRVEGVRFELTYLREGWKEELDLLLVDEQGNVLGTTKYKGTAYIDKLSFAQLLVFQFPAESIRGSAGYFLIGPEIALTLGTNYKAELPDFDYSEEDDVPDWSKVGFGIVAGGGVSLPAGNNEACVDVRYSLGLSNMNTGKWDYTVTTHSIQLVLGFNFLRTKHFGE